MSNFMNNYNDIVMNKSKFCPNSTSKNTNNSQIPTTIQINRRTTTSNASSSSPRITRPTSATSTLLNMVNQTDFNPLKYQMSTAEQSSNNLVKSKTIGAMRSIAGKSPLRSLQTPSKFNHNNNNNPTLLASPLTTTVNVDNSGQKNNGQDDMNDISFASQTSTATTTTTLNLKKSSNHQQHHHNNNNQNQNRKVPPYLSRDFHPCDWPKENDCFNTIGQYPVQEQEQLLLRDLLFVLIGIEGRFIRLLRSQDSSHYKLMLDPSTDHFFAVTTQRILKICYHYSTIISFVESRVYGLVNQALVASIHQHLYDYNMTICQMEDSLMKNDLFLQKMFFILLPYFSTFALLKEICAKLYKNKSVGGSVLTLLHEKTKSIQGMDNNALELCLTLTKSAAIPYFDIMKTWIYYGEIGDPRKEFFIEDTHSQQSIGVIGNYYNNNNNPNGERLTTDNINSSNNNIQSQNQSHQQNDQDLVESDDEYDDDFGKFNDKYWDVRYRINSSKTPCFLRKYEQVIYKTGKYVSIINKVKQLFLKSSKVIPIPQSIFQQQQQQQQLQQQLHNQGATTTVGSSILQSDSVSSFVPKQYGTNTNSPFMFMNNPNVNNHNYYGHNNHPSTNPMMADNTSFAYSMASSSSSNASSSGGGGGGRVNTPIQPANTMAAIFTPKPEEIYYSFDESTYLTPIQSAYEEASSQLLHILVHESQLVETFNAVRHYMLLSMGDFIVHFMKFASKDLCKRTDSVVQHRLDSMMGMALGISVCHSDRQYLKDDPHVEFVGKSFLKQIYQIMKPFATQEDNSFSTSFVNDPSPSSSYLLRCDEDADDDDDNDVALNRSIISSVIEDQDFNATADSIDSIIRRPPKYLNNKNTNSPKSKSLDNKSIGGGGGGSTLKKKPITMLETNHPCESSKLFCYESLMLKFDVPFPLSLIFTQKSVVCYELLFRYIFLCRYAEMELEETWKDNILNVQLKRCDTLSLLNQLTNNGTDQQQQDQTKQARLLAKSFKSIHKKAFALRYKMIAFVRNFHYFYAFEVIDPSFSQFISQITKRGSSLDSVIECHEKFLEHCFSSCFLTSLEITTIIIKIFTLCIELSHLLKDSIDAEDQSTMMESSCFFGQQSSSSQSSYPKQTTGISKNLAKEFDSAANSEDEDLIQEKLNRIYFSNRIFGGLSNHQNKGLGQASGSYTIKEIIDKANTEFDSLVSQLLKKIYSDNCEYHMMFPFVARLDYNDFYRFQIMDLKNSSFVS
uniref:Spindle pole body component 97-like n=1 Tax=Dermatophagoides pteronyssinus TaxID=6956 RepID=A0A6P6XXX0_DERPT|nr:spindle pole body component 97-like [Dermatophagoides pteronyssinus]